MTEKSVFDEEINPIYSRINLVIIIINVAVFLASDFDFSSQSIIDRGALSWDDVINHNEYYRIITSMFLHIDTDHLFNNMLVLLFTGAYLENRLGKFRYLLVYMGSGVLAGCTSMVYNMRIHDYTVSVGASGAIFGVMGALICIVLISRRKIDIRKIMFMAFLCIYEGLTSPGVDNAAHIGGMVAGFIITAVIMLVSERKDFIDE